MVEPSGDPKWDTAVEKTYEANENTFALPANPAGEEFEAAWQDAVNRVLNGQQEPAGGDGAGPGGGAARARRGLGRVGRAVTVARRGQAAAHAPTPNGRRDGRRRRETRAALLFISPWIVGFLVFTAWPVIYTGYLSLHRLRRHQRPDASSASTTSGELLEDPKVALALKNTFIFAALSVPAQLLVSLALALLLNWAGRASGFFRTAFFLPKMTPPVAVGVLLLLLFNGQSGLINEVLGTVRHRRARTGRPTPPGSSRGWC